MKWEKKVIKNKKTGKLISLSELLEKYWKEKKTFSGPHPDRVISLPELLDKWKEPYEKMKWEKEVRERVQKDIEDAQKNSNQKD